MSHTSDFIQILNGFCGWLQDPLSVLKRIRMSLYELVITECQNLERIIEEWATMVLSFSYKVVDIEIYLVY